MAVLLKANVDDVMKIAKDTIAMVEPSFKELPENQRNDLEKIMRKRISDEIQLSDSLADAPKLSDVALVEKMKKLLSDADYKMISGYVDQETYTMEISNAEATVLRGNKKFREAIQLKSVDGIIQSSTYQIVSLVAECVFFVIGAVGFKVMIEESLMRRIIDEIMPVVRQPAFQRVVDNFLAAWARGGTWEKAKAIFNLVRETNAYGIFWKIVQSAFHEMSLWEKVGVITVVAAMVAVEFATDGVALIAKLALSVNDAVNLGRKIANLNKLKDMYAALNK